MGLSYAPGKLSDKTCGDVVLRDADGGRKDAGQPHSDSRQLARCGNNA